MTVKDIFDLRKQGRIEEAYEAIRPMYAQYKGRYTTLCMFWTAADVFKLRLEQGRVEDATKILEALKRMLPRVEEITKQLDSERPTASEPQSQPEPKLPWERKKANQESTSASAFIASATRRLAKIKNNSQYLQGFASVSEQANDNIKQVKDSQDSPDFAQQEKKQSQQGTNPQDPQDIVSASEHEKKEPSQGKDHQPTETTDAQLLKEYQNHAIVSLEDGIIRPIEGINPPQRIVLACITANPGYNVPQISDSTGIPAKSIERHISVLIDKGYIEHRGSKKSGGYHVK